MLKQQNRAEQSRAEAQAPSSTQPHPVPDSSSTAEACPTLGLAERIAHEQIKQLEQLELIDYDLGLVDPMIRATVFHTLRHAAERELDR